MDKELELRQELEKILEEHDRMIYDVIWDDEKKVHFIFVDEETGDKKVEIDSKFDNILF